MVAVGEPVAEILASPNTAEREMVMLPVMVVPGVTAIRSNSDADIMYSLWNGTSWSAPASITVSNNFAEQFPAVCYAADGRAVAAWVERNPAGDKLVYRVLTDGTWGDPGLIYESSHYIEEPRLVVDSSNKVTAVWRGYLSGEGDLFLSWAMLDTLSWSEPKSITNDSFVDWNVSLALSANSEVLTCWSKYDPTDGTSASSSGFGDTVNLAQAEPGSASLTGGYSDAVEDSDSDGFYDFLNVSVEVAIETPGAYGLRADLFGTGKLYTAIAQVQAQASGNQTVTFAIPGGVISNSRQDGPYVLKNVVLFDQNDSPIQVDFSAAPDYATSTGTFTYDLFAPGPLTLDESLYQGSLGKALITVKDPLVNVNASLAETVSVKIVSSMDPVGFDMALTEKTADSGIFTGQLGFSFTGSNTENRVIQVADRGLVQVFYDAEYPVYRWVENAVWLSSAQAGDLNADSQIDLKDAVLALKILSGAQGAVDAEYLATEVQIDADRRIGVPEVVYIMQIVSRLRE